MAKDVTMTMPNTGSGRFFIIPQVPEDREILKAVDSKTSADCAELLHFVFEWNWLTTTVATVAVETLVEMLASQLKAGEGGDGMTLDFFDLITEKVSIKNNSHAEKEGNINISFSIGDRIRKLISDGPDAVPMPMPGYDPANFFLTGDFEEDKCAREYNHKLSYNLSTKHSISFSYDNEDGHSKEIEFGAVAIGYIYIKNLFEQLLIKLAQTPDDEEQHVSVNFNDLIEIHMVLKNGEVETLLRPGMNSKLLIKCDAVTEHTMGDEGDD